MIKIFLNSGSKLILSLIIGCILFLGSNVYAKTLTIEEVKNGVDNSSTLKAINSDGKITTAIDSENKKFNVYYDGGIIYSLPYTDQYIEYDNRSAVVTEELLAQDIATVLLFKSIAESILTLSGHKMEGFPDYGSYYFLGYDNYGIDLITEKFSFSSTDDSGNTSVTEGDFVRYFRLTFDTDKVDSFVEKFGSKQDPNKDTILGLKPTLRVENITENSVTIYPNVNYNAEDAHVSCYVYRSESENGPFEKVSDWQVNCTDGSVGMVDENLKSGTTYYYKAVVVDGNNYSDVLSVSTKGSSTVSNGETVKNPSTGVSFPTLIILLTIIFGLIGLAGSKKKEIFKEI